MTADHQLTAFLSPRHERSNSVPGTTFPGGPSVSGVLMRVTRALSAVALSVALIVGLTACSLIGNRLMTPDPPVRELQRESARHYRDEWQPNVEKIRFTQEGGRGGVGAPWGVNAIATVAGVDYQVIIGPEIGPGFVGDNGVPPEAPTPAPHLPLSVIYSDGSSEVIE